MTRSRNQQENIPSMAHVMSMPNVLIWEGVMVSKTDYITQGIQTEEGMLTIVADIKAKADIPEMMTDTEAAEIIIMIAGVVAQSTDLGPGMIESSAETEVSCVVMTPEKRGAETTTALERAKASNQTFPVMSRKARSILSKLYLDLHR